MKIKKMNLEERPRERLSIYGVKTLTNTELIAILLSRGIKNKNAIEISREILKKHRLRDLNKISFQELENIKGIGFTKACSILAAAELGNRIQNFSPMKIKKINSPKSAFKELKQDLQIEQQEKLVALFLNSRSNLIEKKTLFIGTVDKQIISSRDIAKEALKFNASKVILAHNHPSGEVEPSESDLKTNVKIKKTLNLMNIELTDHLIICANKYFSFQENDLL